MITLKDWLTLRRQGINLFCLDETTIIKAFTALNFSSSLASFMRELKVFFAGYDETAQSEPKQGGAVITDKDIFFVASLVPNWEGLTWFEATQIANQVLEQRTRERSELLCLINNVHASRPQDARQPRDFNPYQIARDEENLRKLRREAGLTAEDDMDRLIKRLKGNE